MQVFYSGMVFLLLSGWFLQLEDAPPRDSTKETEKKSINNPINTASFVFSTHRAYASSEESLACQDTVVVSLNSNCTRTILPDEILEGDLTPWNDTDFVIEVLDERPENLNIIDGTGIHRYKIYHKEDVASDWEGCAGFIKAEDKKAPVLDCKEEVRFARFTKEIQKIESVLKVENDGFNLKEGCEEWPSALEEGDHYYEVFSFQVSQTGWYTLELQADWGAGFGALYHQRFDSDNLCDRLIACADLTNDEAGFYRAANTARLFAYLHPGQEYLLLTTSLQKEQTGAFQWVSYADGEAFIQGLEREEASVYYPLFCGDLDKVIDRRESLEWLESITAVEDCSPFKTRFTDEVITRDPCSDAVVRRKIEVTDEWENSAHCTQDLIFARLKAEDILPPVKRVYISCDSFYVRDDNGHPHPSMTGYPGIWSPFGIRSLRLQECNWAVSYYDREKKGLCEPNTTIVRHWEILDWCNPEGTLSFKQEIVVGDFKGPSFDIQLPERSYLDRGRDTFIVSTGPFDCRTTLPIPAPVNIKDNCSGKTTSKAILTSLEGDTLALKAILGDEIIFEDLTPGEYRLTYLVTDDCLNESRKTLALFVRDLITPVAICNDEFNISIGGDGVGRLTSEDVSEGSWDACTDAPELSVRRWIPEHCVAEYKAATGLDVLMDSIRNIYYTPWAKEIFFTCCDLQEKVRIELEVKDEAGNVDYCWQEALIEDKTPPVCVAPPSDTLTCTEYFVSDITDSLELQELFGTPTIKNEHCPASWIELPAIWKGRECNEGRLTRRFIAIDASGNRSDTCFQYIDVRKEHNYEIKFPKDVLNYGCAEALQDTMEWNELGCDLLAISKDTSIFAVDGDFCYEWQIRHRVINWCEVKGNPVAVGISRNEDKDDEIGEDDVYVIVRPDGRAFVDDNNDETDGFLQEVTSTGYWEYTQVIEIVDTIAPTIIPDHHEPFCTYTEDCVGGVDFFFTLFDFCGENDLKIRVFYDENDDGIEDDTLSDDQVRGRVPKFRLRGDYPLGDHSFRIEITDGCGNTVREQFQFSVVDCKAPAPICVEQLSVELSPVFPARDVDGDGDEDSGMNVVWVSDFRPVSRFEDCTEIRYSIHRVDEIAHPDSNNILVTCDDPNPLQVCIYAWDSSFNPDRVQPDSSVGGPNYDYCTAFIDIQDNLHDLCNGGFSTNVISGKINTQEGVPVEGVTVHLSGGTERMEASNDQGSYTFSEVRTGYDYTLTPGLPQEPLDGVSTFDLVLISKFILGIQNFTSPHQFIAADVNRSGAVSTLDLIQLRKMILHIEKEFPNNDSWRFVDAAFPMEGDVRNWLRELPEGISINNFNPFLEKSHDFIAVKVGDVNSSNSVIRKWVDNEDRRDAKPLDLTYRVSMEETGEAIVNLYADVTGIEGFQFTLSFDPERYAFRGAAFHEAIMNEENVGLKFVSDGLLMVSWNGPVPVNTKKTSKLLSFRLRPLYEQNGAPLPLELNSRLIPSEAYDQNHRIHPLQLSAADPGKERFTVLKAAPNPFRDRTNLSFFLPEAGEVTLEVIDQNGQRLFSQNYYFNTGWNQLIIRNEELKGSGLYFYRLKNQQAIHTGKLMVIR